MSARRFFSPGWFFGFVAVVLFAVACFWFLAPWQLGKNEQLNARNDRLQESTHAPPVALTEAQATADPASLEWHLVTATGRYDADPGHEVLLRLRPIDGTHVYQVLTPFRAENGSTVLVNRGWVPVGQAGAVPDYAPPPHGTVTITGRWRMPEDAALEPTEIDARHTVRSLNPTAISTMPTMAGVTYAPQYLALTTGQPGTLQALPTPSIETGPYLSYGLQWIAFGIIAPAALIYFVTAEIRNRRASAQLSARRKMPTSSTGTVPISGRTVADAADTDGGPEAPAEQQRESYNASHRAAAKKNATVPNTLADNGSDAIEYHNREAAGGNTTDGDQAELLSQRYGARYNAAEHRRSRRSRSRF